MNRDHRELTRRAARWVNVAFLASAAASVGLAITYALGGQPQVEGALIGVAFAGLGIGFVLWGKHLLPQGPYVEERHPMESTPAEREAIARDLEESEAAVTRRGFLRTLGLAIVALGAALVFPIRSLGPSPGRSLFRTSWRPGSRVVTAEGTPVRADSLQEGGVLTVFPEGHTTAADSQTVLIKIDPAEFRPAPGREDWAPDGNVAYSKICTHAGCPVGLYEASTNRLFCPCHQSVFDVLDAAAPAGGPATRPLPQLPLGVDAEGLLVARGDFSAAVGPAFWNRGSGP